MEIQFFFWDQFDSLIIPKKYTFKADKLNDLLSTLKLWAIAFVSELAV